MSGAPSAALSARLNGVAIDSPFLLFAFLARAAALAFFVPDVGVAAAVEDAAPSGVAGGAVGTVGAT